MMFLKIYFFYQPTCNTLELEKGKGTYYVLSWKSKGVKPLHNAFLHSIKLSRHGMGKN